MSAMASAWPRLQRHSSRIVNLGRGRRTPIIFLENSNFYRTISHQTRENPLVGAIGHGPSLIPMKQREAEGVFEAYVQAGCPVATIVRGCEKFTTECVDLLDMNELIDRSHLTLLETKSLDEVLEAIDRKSSSRGSSDEIWGDRLMISLPADFDGSTPQNTSILEQAIDFAERQEYPSGYGFTSVGFSHSEGEGGERVEAMCKVARKVAGAGAPSNLRAVQCPVNIFEIGAVDESGGQVSALEVCKANSLSFYADNSLHTSPMYAGGTDPVSFLRDAPGAAAAAAAASLEMEGVSLESHHPAAAADDSSSSDVREMEQLTKSIQSNFNAAMGLEKQYAKMYESEAAKTGLPVPSELAWGQIILASSDDLQNALRWEYARRCTITPSAEANIRMLKGKGELEEWGQQYLRVLMNLLDLFSASVHRVEGKKRRRLESFLSDAMPNISTGAEEDVRLEDFCLSLVRSTGVSCLLTDAQSALRLAPVPPPKMTASEALEIMREARSFYETNK